MQSANDLAVEYEWLNQQLALIDQEIRSLEEQHSMLVLTKESIEAIKGSANSEVLIPGGAGVYFKGLLTNDSLCLVNVGANVIIEMSVDKALRVVSERIDQLLSLIVQLNNEGERLFERLNNISLMLQQGVKK